MGKRTAQTDAIKDITSDSQVNSYFPYRWSPACQKINIYFYLFLYLYKTRVTINSGTSKITKKTKEKNRLGLTASNKITGRGGGGGLKSNEICYEERGGGALSLIKSASRCFPLLKCFRKYRMQLIRQIKSFEIILEGKIPSHNKEPILNMSWLVCSSPGLCTYLSTYLGYAPG